MRRRLLSPAAFALVALAACGSDSSAPKVGPAALIELSASGQLAMRRLFAEHVKRVEWDASRFPVRLYPFLSAATPSQERSIVIDPRIAFGRPVVQRKGISTLAIAERIDLGESVDDIAADYELGPSEIEQAVLYERAA